MVAFPRFQRLTGSIPVAGAAILAVLTAAAVALMPGEMLEARVEASGIAAWFPAAQPPLGHTARAVLALGAAGLVAAVAWSALYLLWGKGGLLVPRTAAIDGVPAVRRADAHPDAPPRRPMSAADLGTPLMEVGPAERSLPKNLDEPLAAYDPVAIARPPRVVPAAKVDAGTPLPRAPRLAPGERLETFELAPVIRFASETRSEAPRGAPSIEQLLRRLEQGASRRAAQG